MNEFKIKIPKVGEKNDFIVIYKDEKGQLHDLKTEKDEFLKSLRFFGRKKREIELMNHVYICENINVKYFEQFLSSVTTKEVVLNTDNYEIFYQFSKKYEYIELQQQIDQFIHERPDIYNAVNELAEQEEDKIDSEKEEIISKNLDISIKNGMLNKIPLKMLARIVNHPSRVINDYHLLTRFIIDTIKKNQSEAETHQDTKNILHLLPSCLDYCTMNSEEITELFSIENDRDFFAPEKSKEKIEEMISREQEMNLRLTDLNKKVSELENETKKLKTQVTENIESRVSKIVIENNKVHERIDKIDLLLNENVKSNKEEISKQNLKLSYFENETRKQINEIGERMNKIESTIKTKEASRKKDISKQSLRISEIENETRKQINEIGERMNEIESTLTTKEASSKEDISKQSLRISEIENETKKQINEIIERMNKIESTLKTKEASNEEEISKQNLRISKIEEENKKKSNETSERISKIEESLKPTDGDKKGFLKGRKIIECNDAIFKYLIENYNTNPVNNGLIKMDGNSYDANCHRDRLPNVIDVKWNGGGWASKDEPNSHIKIDFLNAHVKINKYRLVSGNSGGVFFFTSWILTGVTSDNQTVVLDEVNNSKEIYEKHTTITREIVCDKYISAIQLTMKGKSSWKSNPLRMIVKNIEIFGSLIDSD